MQCVKTALKFKKADVLVSTDSEEIRELALLYGAKYIKRPKVLTKNSACVPFPTPGGPINNNLMVFFSSY